MDRGHLDKLKADYLDALRAAMHARDVAARAVQQVEIGAAREVPPELISTLRELEDLAAERQRIYFSSIAQDLLCTQVEECKKKAGR